MAWKSVWSHELLDTGRKGWNLLVLQMDAQFACLSFALLVGLRIWAGFSMPIYFLKEAITVLCAFARDLQEKRVISAIQHNNSCPQLSWRTRYPHMHQDTEKGERPCVVLTGLSRGKPLYEDKSIITAYFLESTPSMLLMEIVFYFSQ